MSDQAHIEFDFDVEDFTAVLQEQTRTRMARRTRLCILAVCALGTLLFGMLLTSRRVVFFFTWDPWVHVPLLLAIGAQFIFFPIWWRGEVRRGTKKFLESPESKRLGRHLFVLDESGIRYEAPLAKGWVAWELVHAIEPGETCLTFDLGVEGVTWVIPRRAFADDDHWRRFIESARRLRQDAPSYERTCPKCGYELTGCQRSGCPECGWRRDGQEA